MNKQNYSINATFCLNVKSLLAYIVRGKKYSHFSLRAIFFFVGNKRNHKYFVFLNSRLPCSLVIVMDYFSKWKKITKRPHNFPTERPKGILGIGGEGIQKETHSKIFLVLSAFVLLFKWQEIELYGGGRLNFTICWILCESMLVLLVQVIQDVKNWCKSCTEQILSFLSESKITILIYALHFFCILEIDV